MLTNTMNCKNCDNTVDNNFCGNCGQPVQIKRVDKHYLLHEMWHILHFEKGIFYTIKELLIRPGQNVREFITEDRSRLVKPIIFIIITSLIYTVINNLFHIEEGYVNFNGTKQSATTLIFNWVQNHYGYANIIMGVYIAFWAKLFYRKYDYNFFEILILLCFVMGMGMLIFSVFALFEGLTKLNLMKISGMIGLTYCTWAIGQFFNQKKVVNYLKALISYVLGMLTFFISATLLGLFIDVFIKH
ncbi:DUF3667 domain-containing protein [Mucilaginibacter sp.]|uniref:DUF3667 domain-containing protein n=1 Tax=Mucilaginibacter sp. TaxID=1882438 RepID=UPI00356564B4